jgi:hypothetical protein
LRNPYKNLVRTSEGNRELGRCRHRWEDSIKIDVMKIMEVIHYDRHQYKYIWPLI